MKFSSMTDEQISTAIAEKMGWFKSTPLKNTMGYPVWQSEHDLPKTFFVYHGEDDHERNEWTWNPTKNENLYQCFLMEEWLIKHDEKKWGLYTGEYLPNCVGIMFESNPYIILEKQTHATASQRCNAFLLATGGCE